MPIDWANEPFVRLFKRETDDDLLLSWEARAVWHEMLKKFDHSGLLETRRGVRGLAALVRVPVDVAERAIAELIEDGRVRSVPSRGFLAPNYIDANFTPRSDGARQEQSRVKRRMDALTIENSPHGAGIQSHDVTRSHETSHDVTQIRSDHNKTDQTQIRSDHQSASPTPRDPSQLVALVDKCNAIGGTAVRTKARRSIPSDWKPRGQERAKATSLGLDPDREAEEFRSYWLGDGRPKKDWDQTFLNRLIAQSKRNPNQRGPTSFLDAVDRAPLGDDP